MNRILNRRDESSRDAAQGPWGGGGGHDLERRRDCSLGPAGTTFCLAFAVSLSVFPGHPPRAEDGTRAGLRNPVYFVVDKIKTKRSGLGTSLSRQMAVTRREPWPSLLAPDHSLPLPLGSQPPLRYPLFPE